jgi:hypothetical protein
MFSGAPTESFSGDGVTPVAWSEHVSPASGERGSYVETAPALTRHGTLREVAGPEWDCWFHSVWNGPISLERRLQNPDSKLTPGAVEDALQSLEDFYRRADPSASIRCADGREAEGWKDNCPLGPQVFAGSAGGAIAKHVVESRFGKSFDQDLEATLAEFESLGIPCGGHTDEHHRHDRDCSGCAGIDKIQEILGTAGKEDLAPLFKKFLKLVLGGDYDERCATNVLDGLKMLQGSDSYFRRGFARRTIDAIGRKVKGAVQTLLGSHNEVALIFNKVLGETFDTTKFSHESGGNIQAFNCDVWEFQALANELYPGTDSYNEERRKEYVICRVILAIATAMVITDGTLQVLTRE